MSSSKRSLARRAPGAAGPFLGLTLILLGCQSPTPSGELRWREAREEAVRQALPAEARAPFAGLTFFPYDSRYRFRAMLVPVTPPEPLTLAASDGRPRPAARVGRLHLRFPAGAVTLTVFQLADTPGDNFFLPFRDAAAGRETYGGGRYVEVRPLGGGVVEVDFNRAYNPDCAYGITASCPVAPAENTLPFAVPVGERLPPLASPREHG